MNRVVAAGLSPFFALAVGARAQTPETPRYNVLFLMADDLRPELGCYGAPVKTPSIDALARAGVRFERAYCQSPLCNPSRSSLLTGRYPEQTGVLGNQEDFRTLHPDWVTLPQLFKKSGYATLATGKIFHGGIEDDVSWTEGGQRRRAQGAAPAPTPAQQKNRKAGSDRIVKLPGNGESHQDYKIADQAITLLEKYQQKPFFLACGFQKPHSPPTAPRRFFELYPLDQLTLPESFAPRPTVSQGFPLASLVPNYDLFIERDATPQEAKEMLQAYRASVSWVDWNVGRVLEKLDALKLRDKTIVVLWGDHGYHLGEWGKWSKHGSLYEVGARVPLIVVAPGMGSNGKSCARIVETVDLYKTLAELAGLTASEAIEGASLVPLLKNPDAAWERPAFTTTGVGKSTHVAVRSERWRYAEYANGQAMLIDESDDPKATRNLADDPRYAPTRQKLAALLKGYRERVKQGAHNP